MDERHYSIGRHLNIGLAKLRLDGFISVDAGGKEGVLLTEPFKFEGDKLVINADATGGEVAVEKRKARELLAKQLISLNGDRTEASESDNSKEFSEDMKRKSVFATKVIITQLMLLFVVICFYFLKLVVVPILIILFSQSFRPGSVIVTCILLFLSLRFLKTMTGLIACRLLLSYGLSKHISYSALLLIYWWLSAFVMLIYGSLLMEHSGGDSGDRRNYVAKAFLAFSSISLM